MLKKKDKGKQRAEDITLDQPEAKIHSTSKPKNSLFTIMKEGIKKPSNIKKLLFIGFSAACNAILAHTSLTVSFVLAGITCLYPAADDFSSNYQLVQNEILKNNKIQTRGSKALEITKFITRILN